MVSFTINGTPVESFIFNESIGKIPCEKILEKEIKNIEDKIKNTFLSILILACLAVKPVEIDIICPSFLF
jgi:hypothetical protein